jgi:hypothetical protein
LENQKMNKQLPGNGADAPRRYRAPYPNHASQTTEVSAASPIRSTSSSAKQLAEVSQLRELETMLREMLDRVELPQVWNNRISKQLRNVEKARSRP